MIRLSSRSSGRDFHLGLDGVTFSEGFEFHVIITDDQTIPLKANPFVATDDGLTSPYAARAFIPGHIAKYSAALKRESVLDAAKAASVRIAEEELARKRRRSENEFAASFGPLPPAGGTTAAGAPTKVIQENRSELLKRTLGKKYAEIWHDDKAAEATERS